MQGQLRNKDHYIMDCIRNFGWDSGIMGSNNRNMVNR